jgi:RNA polymerase sigma factor (sigma-70 family)
MGIFQGFLMRGEVEEGDESAEVCEGVSIEGLEGEWRRYLIWWAMRQLSERERQVLERLYGDGYTEEEIAQELGISQRSAK